VWTGAERLTEATRQWVDTDVGTRMLLMLMPTPCMCRHVLTAASYLIN